MFPVNKKLYRQCVILPIPKEFYEIILLKTTQIYNAWLFDSVFSKIYINRYKIYHHHHYFLIWVFISLSKLFTYLDLCSKYVAVLN